MSRCPPCWACSVKAGQAWEPEHQPPTAAAASTLCRRARNALCPYLGLLLVLLLLLPLLRVVCLLLALLGGSSGSRGVPVLRALLRPEHQVPLPQPAVYDHGLGDGILTCGAEVNAAQAGMPASSYSQLSSSHYGGIGGTIAPFNGSHTQGPV